MKINSKITGLVTLSLLLLVSSPVKADFWDDLKKDAEKAWGNVKQEFTGKAKVAVAQGKQAAQGFVAQNKITAQKLIAQGQQTAQAVAAQHQDAAQKLVAQGQQTARAVVAQHQDAAHELVAQSQAAVTGVVAQAQDVVGNMAAKA